MAGDYLAKFRGARYHGLRRPATSNRPRSRRQSDTIVWHPTHNNVCSLPI